MNILITGVMGSGKTVLSGLIKELLKKNNPEQGFIILDTEEGQITPVGLEDTMSSTEEHGIFVTQQIPEAWRESLDRMDVVINLRDAAVGSWLYQISKEV